MELTKKDQRKIEDDTRLLASRIEAEASEYAHLYRRTYLETLIERLKDKIEVSDYVQEHSKNL